MAESFKDDPLQAAEKLEKGGFPQFRFLIYSFLLPALPHPLLHPSLQRGTVEQRIKGKK